jgi:hypothetical protein
MHDSDYDPYTDSDISSSSSDSKDSLDVEDDTSEFHGTPMDSSDHDDSQLNMGSSDDEGTNPFNFPNSYIKCNLSTNAISLPYSIDSVAKEELKITSTYGQQIKAYYKYIVNPPLDKKSLKGSKSKMEPVAPSTAKVRLRSINHFIGYLVLHLNLGATMEHILVPDYVAQYWGFLLARINNKGEAGLTPDTIKLRMQHLDQAIEFVISQHCPPKTKLKRSKEYMEALVSWYTNLMSTCLAKCKAKISIPKHDITTLWRCWEYSEVEMKTWVQDFVVSQAPFIRKHQHRPVIQFGNHYLCCCL